MSKPIEDLSLDQFVRMFRTMILKAKREAVRGAIAGMDPDDLRTRIAAVDAVAAITRQAIEAANRIADAARKDDSRIAFEILREALQKKGADRRAAHEGLPAKEG
jgi:hypothetical protein